MPTLVVSIATSGNDGRWRSGAFSSTDDDTFIGGGANNKGYFLFTGLTALAGATITSASIEFVAAASDSDAAAFVVRARAANNPQAPTTESQANTATRHATTVLWNSVPSFTAGSTYTTPDITTLVQALVNDGYLAAGVILFYLEPNGTTGQRDIASYDHATYAPAKLTVTYATTVEVTADRSLAWNVRSPVTADRTLSWAVRSGVTADRNLSWSVRSAITADRSLSWAVRQAITADRALAWSVRQAVATDRDLAWAVRQLVESDRVLLWDVEPAVGVVVVDRGLSWDIRAIVSADRAVSWDVRALTAADSVLLWDVRELAESDRDLAWAVREIVEADRELIWRVRTNAIIRQISVHGSARAAQAVTGAPHVLAASGSLHVMPAVSGSLREGISATGSARQPVIVKGSPA